MNFNQAVNLLQNQIDWESFFNLRSIMEREMNRPSERFFKSGIIERGLCHYSNGVLSYIDEPGRDCQFNEYPTFFLEIKGNQSNWNLRDFASFRLVNGNSNRKIYSELPETYAQFCLFHNLENVFLCESYNLNKYIVCNGTGNIDIKVPINVLTPLGKKMRVSIKKINSLSSYFDAALEEFYVSIKNL